MTFARACGEVARLRSRVGEQRGSDQGAWRRTKRRAPQVRRAVGACGSRLRQGSRLPPAPSLGGRVREKPGATSAAGPKGGARGRRWLHPPAGVARRRPGPSPSLCALAGLLPPPPLRDAGMAGGRGRGCGPARAPSSPSLPWSGGGRLFGLAAAMPPPPSPSPPWLGRRGWGFGSACAAPSLPSVARWRPGSSPPFRALARRADATASPSPPCLVVAGDWGRGAFFGREDPRPPPQRAGAARMAIHLRMARWREEPAGGGLGQRPRGAGRGEGGSANRWPLVAGLTAGILRDDVAQ